MIIFDATLFFIIITTGLLGICSGLLGSFLFLQRKSLFADTIAHATLPGITGFFFITYNKNPWLLLIAGIISSILAAYVIYFLQRYSTLKNDAILGVVLSTFLGIGTIFLSKIQTIASSNYAGLSKLLIGNTTALLHQDLYQISLLLVARYCLSHFFLTIIL